MWGCRDVGGVGTGQVGNGAEWWEGNGVTKETSELFVVSLCRGGKGRKGARELGREVQWDKKRKRNNGDRSPSSTNRSI